MLNLWNLNFPDVSDMINRTYNGSRALAILKNASLNTTADQAFTLQVEQGKRVLTLSNQNIFTLNNLYLSLSVASLDPNAKASYAVFGDIVDG